jgi:hypothetical protein
MRRRKANEEQPNGHGQTLLKIAVIVKPISFPERFSLQYIMET